MTDARLDAVTVDMLQTATPDARLDAVDVNVVHTITSTPRNLDAIGVLVLMVNPATTRNDAYWGMRMS